MTLPRGANEVRSPRQQRLILGLLAEVDRIFFEDHAGTDSNTRMYIPGEVGVEMDAVATLVTQLKPGLRIRRFILPAELEGE